VEEQDQEEKEGDLTSLKDLDQALSDGASSWGDDLAVAGSPNLQDLVYLGQEH
jgi:hypothetical protein